MSRYHKTDVLSKLLRDSPKQFSLHKGNEFGYNGPSYNGYDIRSLQLPFDYSVILIAHMANAIINSSIGSMCEKKM